MWKIITVIAIVLVMGLFGPNIKAPADMRLPNSKFTSPAPSPINPAYEACLLRTGETEQEFVTIMKKDEVTDFTLGICEKERIERTFVEILQKQMVSDLRQSQELH